jgi:hypothetical protein
MRRNASSDFSLLAGEEDGPEKAGMLFRGMEKKVETGCHPSQGDGHTDSARLAAQNITSSM